MDRYFILDEQGNPVPADALTWALWLEANLHRRVVRQEAVAPGVEVSTVFLGLNHRHGGGPPLIYETVVFRGDVSDECRRYSTRAEAEAGHAEVVSEVLNGKPAAEE